MHSVSAFLDMTNVAADIVWKKWWYQRNLKSASRDLCIFWIFFGYNCAKIYLYRICVTNFREGRFLPPPPPSTLRPICEQPPKSPSWIGLKQMSLFVFNGWIVNFDHRQIFLKMDLDYYTSGNKNIYWLKTFIFALPSCIKWLF